MSLADGPRRAALDRIERTEKTFKALAFIGAIVEGAFLIAFVLLANFRDRLHVLLLLSTVTVYSLTVVGLFALGAHISRCAERVVRAVEATRPRDPSEHA